MAIVWCRIGHMATSFGLLYKLATTTKNGHQYYIIGYILQWINLQKLLGNDIIVKMGMANNSRVTRQRV